MKNNLLLVLTLFTLVSCDTQLGTGIVTAVKNLVTGKSFGNSIGDASYAEYQKKPENITIKNDNMCMVKVESVAPMSDGTMKGLSKIRDLLCSCKTWGTCAKDSCNCEVLCPDDFSILNRTGLALDDSEANSLAFTNGELGSYTNDSTYMGYCWGHAVMTSQFNRLAKFEPNKPLPLTGEENDDARTEYYTNIITKLRNNEAVDIPGFNNLSEFSAIPSIKKLLVEQIKQTWAENAMTFQGLTSIASSTPQPADYYNTLFDDVENRLKNFQAPTIVMNKKSNSLWSHAVLVSGAGVDQDGNRYLCIRDNNYPPIYIANCGAKLTLDKTTGTCSYSYGGEIGKVLMSHSENSNTVTQIKNLRSKCLDEKTCPKE